MAGGRHGGSRLRRGNVTARRRRGYGQRYGCGAAAHRSSSLGLGGWFRARGLLRWLGPGGGGGWIRACGRWRRLDLCALAGWLLVLGARASARASSPRGLVSGGGWPRVQGD